MGTGGQKSASISSRPYRNSASLYFGTGADPCEDDPCNEEEADDVEGAAATLPSDRFLNLFTKKKRLIQSIDQATKPKNLPVITFSPRTVYKKII